MDENPACFAEDGCVRRVGRRGRGRVGRGEEASSAQHHCGAADGAAIGRTNAAGANVDVGECEAQGEGGDAFTHVEFHRGGEGVAVGVLVVSGGVALVAALVATATGSTAGAATLARHLVDTSTARLHITMYLYL